jgi:hypothetical protein
MTNSFSNAFNSASSASYGQSSQQISNPYAVAAPSTTMVVPPGGGNDGKTVTLVNGQKIDLAEARLFMDFYCTRSFFNSSSP